MRKTFALHDARWERRKMEGAKDRRLVVDQLAAALGEDGRAAAETCPLLLAAFGRDPSDAATGWSNGATVGGPHKAARAGLQDFWMGSPEPMMPIEGEIVLRWRQMRVDFPPAKAKMLIPVQFGRENEEDHFHFDRRACRLGLGNSVWNSEGAIL